MRVFTKPYQSYRGDHMKVKGWPFEPLDKDIGTKGTGEGFPPNGKPD